MRSTPRISPPPRSGLRSLDSGDAPRRAALGGLLALAACGPAPPSTPQSGYVPITVPVDLDPTTVLGATLAGVMAFDLRADGDRLQLTPQGAPEPGPADLVLHTAGGDVTVDDAVEFIAPHPAFARVAALGASLTQGVQGGVPTFHGGLMSPAAQLARQLGGWFPLPLLVDGLWPQVTPADVGPPPDCAVPDVAGFVAQAASDILPTACTSPTPATPGSRTCSSTRSPTSPGPRWRRSISQPCWPPTPRRRRR